jgi:predicted unusual protein kinase regulating ubiquinone biosynthesis (AarF/ABC1/UbiB family)
MPEAPVKIGIRDELRVLLKLYPVFRRYTKDRTRVKKNEEHAWDPKIEANGQKAVNTFIYLGPTYIKLGQVISARPDLLPNEYIKAFEQLQDSVPPAPFPEVKPVIEKNLGKIYEVFDSFNEDAISGASLGQVYLARYHGEDVVVKVNRPNIQEKVKKDIAVISRLLNLARRRLDTYLYVSLDNVIADFRGRIFDEADYLKESSNIMRIGDNIRKRQEKVIVPEVYEELTTSQVLVMKYHPGIKITDIQTLKSRGIDLKNLAWRFDLLFMRMLLRDKIFHADPHPGNISVTDDGSIILYDYGMVGSLDEKTRFQLLKLYDGLSNSDPDVIMDSLISMNALSPVANRAIMRRTMELAIANLQGKPVEEREVQEIFSIANDVIFEFPFRLPRELVLYMRMSSLLEGTCKLLDPDFRFIAILRQILYQEGMLNDLYRFQITEFVRKSISSIEKGLDVLPLLKRTLEEQSGNSTSRSSIKIPASIFLGFLTLASVYLSTTNSYLGFSLLGVSIIMFLLLLFKRN